MRLITLVVLFFVFPFSGNSQIQGEDEVYLNGDRIEAKFNGGGLDNFGKFIDKEFDYSKVTKPGKMVGAFTIDTEGNIKNIKIIEFFDVESATEFIRVLKKCPKWEPAKRGGKPISIEIKYPMVFRERQKVKVISENTIASNISNDTIYEAKTLENKPEFPGGINAFFKFIGKSFNIPDVAGLNGKIHVTFVVEVDGSLTNINVLKDIGYGTKEETIRVLNKCSKWSPGMLNGKAVRTQVTFPISIAAAN